MSFKIEKTIDQLNDFNTDLTNDDRSKIAEQLDAIKYALLDSKCFSELIEIRGRNDSDVYKSELRHSASLNLERLERVLY
jgi:Fic family protein